MTNAEIYDRTLLEVTRAFWERYGERADTSAGRGLIASITEINYQRYLIARRRRPWCRVPWQMGRRPSPSPNPITSRIN